MEEVKHVNIPKYDEVSVKSIFPLFKLDHRIMQFLPNTLPKDKLPDRQYFFNCLNTVYPENVKKLLDHANKLRFKSGFEGSSM